MTSWREIGDGLASFAHWWNADRAMVPLNALLVAGALVTAVIGLRQLRQQAADSHARSRPVVTVDLAPVPHTDSIDLVVQNAGASSARDLHVVFDPPIPADEIAADGEPSLVAFIAKRYSHPVGVLPPGRALSNVYSFSATNPEQVAEQFTATVSYRDDDGNAYHDTYPLDLQLITNGTRTTSSASPEGRLKTAVDHLNSIARGLRKVEVAIPDLTAATLGRDAEVERAAWHRERVAAHQALVARVPARQEAEDAGPPDAAPTETS